MEQANFSELREKINDWDIQAEALLIQKIRLFSVNYNEDFQSLCQNFTNFSNHISSTEVEHLRAINQLKSISNEKFIEQSLQNYEQIQPENIINEEIIMNPSEKMKKSLEISIQNIESFPKKRKKEAIEDDSASLASSKIIIEKETKGLKIPYIIGTEMFNAEKAIGLDVDIKTYKPINGAKEFTGTFKGFDKDTFTIEFDDGTVDFNRSDVAQVRLSIDF